MMLAMQNELSFFFYHIPLIILNHQSGYMQDCMYISVALALG